MSQLTEPEIPDIEEEEEAAPEGEEGADAPPEEEEVQALPTSEPDAEEEETETKTVKAVKCEYYLCLIVCIISFFIMS